MGNWLAMINESFGMEMYSSTTPYYSNVDASDPFFATVQIAVEWDVINPQKDKIDVNKDITWKQALITLVNVGKFVSDDKNDDEKIEYAIEHFDKSIRKYWLKRTIEVSKALELLTTAQSQWVSREYDTVEEVEFKDGVLDLTDQDIDYVMDGDTIIMPETAADIESGDLFVLGAKEGAPTANAHKATSVRKEDGNLIIDTSDDDNLDLDDLVDNLELSGTIVPKMENAIVYDGNGNVISVGDQATIPSNKRSNVMAVGGKSVSKTFDVNGYEVTLKYNLSGDANFSVKITKKLSDDLNLINEVSIDSLKLTHDFSLGRRYALLKFDYQTSETMSAEYSGTPVDLVFGPDNNRNTGLKNFKENLANSYFKGKDSKGTGAKTVKICSVTLANGWVARVCLDVEFVVRVDGTFTIKLTQSGSKGIEYSKGNIRSIKTEKTDRDIQIKAKIETTLSIGPAIYAIGLKKRILGFGFENGVGIDVDMKFNIADSMMHRIEILGASLPPERCESVISASLTEDAMEIKALARANGGTYETELDIVPLKVYSCVEIGAYGIGKLKLSDSYVAKWLGDKIKPIEMPWNDKTICTWHIDNFDWANSKLVWGENPGNLCSFEFIDFEGIEEEEKEETEEETEDDESYMTGNNISLSTMVIVVDPGETYQLRITALPEGYSSDDIVFSCDSESIASVSNSGFITTADSGTAIITAMTKDGVYKTYCSLTVRANTPSGGGVNWD